MSEPRIPAGSMTADELAELKARMMREDPDYRARVRG